MSLNTQLLSNVQRWIAESKGVTEEAIAAESVPAGQLSALSQLYALFQGKECETVLGELGVAEVTEVDAAEVRQALAHVRAVAEKHKTLRLAERGCWKRSEVANALSARAVHSLLPDVLDREGDIAVIRTAPMFREHVTPLLQMDRRIALLETRDAVRNVLRPHITAEEYRILFEYLSAKPPHPAVIDAYFIPHRSRYEATPLHTQALDEALELVDAAENDAEAAEWKKLFLDEFSDYVVLRQV